MIIMICNYCQTEFDDSVQFCPACGAPVVPPKEKAPDYFAANQAAPTGVQSPLAPDYATQSINPLLAKTDSLIKDNLFLAVCILQSVATAVPLFGDFKSFNILTLLITIFLWIIFADSKKGELPNPSRIRVISGVLCAYKILLYVAAGLCALLGVICFFSASAFIKYFTDAFSESAEITTDLDKILSVGGWVIGIAFLFVAVFIAVLTYFSYAKMHGFVRSCYTNIQNGYNSLDNRNVTSIWLIIFAVLLGIGALGSLAESPITAVVNGVNCATCILSYILLKKYYSQYA
jgi:hypothetical protein